VSGNGFGEVLYLDSLGNGLGEGLEAERASRDYGLRIVGQEVSYRGLAMFYKVLMLKTL
jgi:hypothetical protein